MTKLIKITNKLFSKNRELRSYTIKWFFYWIGVMGFYSLAMRAFPKPTITFALVSVTYFTASSILAIHLFYSKQKESFNIFISITISLAIFCFIIPLLDNVIPLHPDTINLLFDKKFFYPLLKIETSIIKAFDITFQQIMIYLFVMKYLEVVKAKSDIIIKFTTVFFIIHIPLFVLFGWSSR